MNREKVIDILIKEGYKVNQKGEIVNSKNDIITNINNLLSIHFQLPHNLLE